MTRSNELIGRRAVQYPVELFEGGLCRDMPSDLFYGEAKETEEQAKAVCGGCSVIEICREWGLDREEFGVWGGMTAAERARYRRGRGYTVRRYHKLV